MKCTIKLLYSHKVSLQKIAKMKFYIIPIFLSTIFCNTFAENEKLEEVLIAKPQLKRLEVPETAGLGNSSENAKEVFEMDLDPLKLGKKVTLKLKATSLPFTEDLFVGILGDTLQEVQYKWPEKVYIDGDNVASIIISTNNQNNSENVIGVFNSDGKCFGVMGDHEGHDHKIFKVQEQNNGSVGYEKVDLTEVEKPPEASGLLGIDFANLFNLLGIGSGHNQEDSIFPAQLIKEQEKQIEEQRRQPVINSNCLKVETFVIIDTKLGQRFASVPEAIDYMAVYLNSVNIRYAGLKNVSGYSVSILLKSLVVNENTEKEPYYNNSFYPGRDVLNSVRLLQEFAIFMADKGKDYYGGRDYDLAILMMTYKMPPPEYPDSTTALALGRAFIPGTCLFILKYAFMYEDPLKTFSSIKTFIHEIGHTIGLGHDGYPGAEGCSRKGFVMGAWIEVVTVHFSNCSGQQLEYFAKGPIANCLKMTNVSSSYQISSSLPGERLARVDYCKHKFPNFPDVTEVPGNNSNLCLITCRSNSQGEQTVVEALDGHPCGDGGICLRDECQPKGTIIPQTCS